MATYVPNEEIEEIDYTEDDMLNMEVLFGSCDIESKLYTICLRDAKTKRQKGWRKYWYPEWTLIKHSCKKEAQELDICHLKTEWRQKIVDKQCHQLNLKYHVRNIINI